MNLQFFNSRNGQLSCSADGRFLHSSFNPQNEAQRFIDSISCIYEASAVAVLGACLPWCVEPLRNRFPGARLIAVQYDEAFKEHEDGWDYVFYISDESDASAFSNSLYSILGEENLMITQFLSWKPSETVWPDKNRASWGAVKACMEKAQSVLTTRNHFAKAWFRNSIRNLEHITTYAVPEKTDLPFVVTASGPSLTKALPFIRKNRSCFRLMAASSSLSTLLSNDIVPDFTISTDGGYYAMRHLRAYSTDERLRNVPLFISSESAVPTDILKHTPIVLLTYGDGIETLLAHQGYAPSIPGLRNGTVSGTAASLATTLTSGAVYMCGLDLAPGKGFQHAEPNENDVPLFTGQSRFTTLETAQASSRYSSGSLALYREWFSTQDTDFTNRVFRLVSETDTLEPLGNIKDIIFEKLILPPSQSQEALVFTKKETSSIVKTNINSYLLSVMNYLSDHPEDDECKIWYSSLALEQYINCLRMNKDMRQENFRLLSEVTIKEIEKMRNKYE